MKKVLVLGAGMVAGAHTRYLLDQPDLAVNALGLDIIIVEATFDLLFEEGSHEQDD